MHDTYTYPPHQYTSDTSTVSSRYTLVVQKSQKNSEKKFRSREVTLCCVGEGGRIREASSNWGSLSKD